MKFVCLLLLTVLILLQYRLWIGHGSLTYVHHLDRQKQAQIEENRFLQERNQSLSAEVNDLKHGFAAIEERARSEMGMIRKDEMFYQIVRLHDEPSDQD